MLYATAAIPLRLFRRFVNLSADPQLVKQYSQLPRYGNDGSFLGILPPALG
jgi:hypothetical protein